MNSFIKIILYTFLIQIVISQTILHEDLKTYSKIFDEFGLNVIFKINNKQSKKIEDGILELNNNNQLKLKLGPKFFFLNMQNLKIFDSRTNQVLIQEPDSNSFTYMKNFFDKKKIVSIDLNEISNNIFTFDYNSYNLEISKIYPGYSCKINFGDYEITFNDILVDTLKFSNEIFDIDTSNSFIIDLRD